MSENTLTAEQRERLKQALQSGSQLGASDLRLINVEAYRERLGDDWFKYKGIINAIATGAIKSELGPHDLQVETKHGYGIIFFDKTMEEVAQASKRISERMERELSREPAFRNPKLGCEARSVDGAELLRELDRNAQEAQQKPKPVVAQTAMPTPPGSYAPLYHTKVQRVLGSLFAPPLPMPLRKPADKDYYAAHENYALQDVRGFTAMLTDAYKLHKAGQSMTILFSLNFRTFASVEFNKEYMQTLRQTPAALVQYLTPRLVRIPPGTGQSLLAAKVQQLSSIFKHIVLHARPMVEFATFEFVPCSILSTSWRDIQNAMTSDRNAARSASAIARQFSQSAKSLRVNSLIAGVDTAEALETALAADVEFVSGAAILGAGDEPFKQRALSLNDTAAARVQFAEPALVARSAASPAARSRDVDFI